MDREQLRDFQQRSQAHALAAEVPLPGMRVLGTLGISGRGTLYAVRWEPRSTREPALLALRVVEDTAGTLRRRLESLAARMQTAPIDGLAMPIDHGTTASGRTYYTTELFERDLGRLPAALLPALPALLTDVARVLAAMHARGLVHGNLRASNVLIKEHAASYNIALCDPALLTGDEAHDPAVDLQAWALLAARVYGLGVARDGSLVPAHGDTGAIGVSMPAVLTEIVESVLAGGGPGPAQRWTARDLVQTLEALTVIDSGGVPRMRLAVGSGPTRSESAHARRALARAGFEVLSCLGQGAAATVFRVRRGGRELAAKVLHGPRAMAQLACVEGMLETLRGAGDAPLAVPEELGTLPTGAAFYTMDVFAGTLRSRAAELDLVELIEILGDVARGLARLHKLGVVHRDLKPSNVLVTRSGQRHRVAVADFESAVRPGEDGAPPAGDLGGALAQRPPEARTGGAVTPAWDIWSWAVTALWALQQREPSLADVDEDARADAGQVQPTAAINEAWLRTCVAVLPAVLSKQLGELLGACLDSDPARRPGADAVAACVSREAARLRAPAAVPRAVDAAVDAGAGEPFAGLAALTAMDEAQCLGRASDVERLVELVAEHPLVVLLGPAGAGKTSLLMAGLVPRLAGDAYPGPLYRPIVLCPGPQPFAALAAAVLAATPGAERVQPSAAHVASLAAALRKRGVAALWPHLCSVSASASASASAGGSAGGSAGARIRSLLIVDQAEELFTAVGDARERQAFAALLGEAMAMSASSRTLTVLLSVHDDFYGRLVSLPLFATSAGHGYHCIQALDRAALQVVLEQAAARCGYVWEDGLAATVAAQAAESRHPLPLLQVMGRELWRLRERDTHLVSRAAWTALGGCNGAVTRWIERLMASLAADDDLWVELDVAPSMRREHLHDVMRDLLLRVVDVQHQLARPVEASELWQPFAPGSVHRRLAERVVPRLINDGLLVCRRCSDGVVESMMPTDIVALAHEALLASWPELQHWLAEERPRRLLLEEVRARAEQWEAAGRARHLLWSGRKFRQQRAHLGRYHLSLRATEAAFWQACEGAERTRHGSYALLALIAALTALITISLLLAG
jgi:tRNA A-37 threonylcarbamoyl transferase component Bud32